MISINVVKVDKQRPITTELQLILHCAPVLRGLKAANTITFQLPDLIQCYNLLKGTDISCSILYHDKKSAIVLLYRKKQLLHVMNQVDKCSYLLQMGYRPLDMEGSLLRLRERMFDYYDGEKDFPHELGVFLEYPLTDILEYVRQKGKNFLYNGYWKVYGKEEEAKQIFQLYEDGKSEMIRYYLKFGKLKIYPDGEAMLNNRLRF